MKLWNLADFSLFLGFFLLGNIFLGPSGIWEHKRFQRVLASSLDHQRNLEFIQAYLRGKKDYLSETNNRQAKAYELLYFPTGAIVFPKMQFLRDSQSSSFVSLLGTKYELEYRSIYTTIFLILTSFLFILSIKVLRIFYLAEAQRKQKIFRPRDRAKKGLKNA